MILDGTKLKMQRVKKGSKCTQKHVADALDVSLGAYRNWEQGVNSPDLSMLTKLANYFDVPLFEILKQDYASFMSNPVAYPGSALGNVDVKSIPVFTGLGVIKTDQNILLPEFMSAGIALPSVWRVDFALEIRNSDFTSAGIPANSIVCCRRQDTADDNDTVYCKIGFSDFQFAQVKLYPGITVLRLGQLSNQEVVIPNKDASLKVSYIGKVIKVITDFEVRM